MEQTNNLFDFLLVCIFYRILKFLSITVENIDETCPAVAWEQVETIADEISRKLQKFQKYLQVAIDSCLLSWLIPPH